MHLKIASDGTVLSTEKLDLRNIKLGDFNVDLIADEQKNIALLQSRLKLMNRSRFHCLVEVGQDTLLFQSLKNIFE